MPIQILQGTLDLMILRTLATMGPQHAYGIASRLQQVSEDALNLNQGTIYPALVRIEQHGWTRGSWGKTENNREAKYYTIYQGRVESSRSRNRTLASDGRRCRKAADGGTVTVAHWRRIIARLRSLLANTRAEDDLAREVASHLTLLADDFEHRGHVTGRSTARRAARLRKRGAGKTGASRRTRSLVGPNKPCRICAMACAH